MFLFLKKIKNNQLPTGADGVEEIWGAGAAAGVELGANFFFKKKRKKKKKIKNNLENAHSNLKSKIKS